MSCSALKTSNNFHQKTAGFCIIHQMWGAIPFFSACCTWTVCPVWSRSKISIHIYIFFIVSVYCLWLMSVAGLHGITIKPARLYKYSIYAVTPFTFHKIRKHNLEWLSVDAQGCLDFEVKNCQASIPGSESQESKMVRHYTGDFRWHSLSSSSRTRYSSSSYNHKNTGDSWDQ